MKLWRVRNAVQIKSFAFDLLTIRLLKDRKILSLTSQLIQIWEEFRDHSASLYIEDPANPEGNDLSDMLDDSVRSWLKQVATSSLATLESFGWEGIFGSVEEQTDEDKKATLVRIAPTIARPVKPYYDAP